MYNMHVEIRGQCAGAYSLLLPCEFCNWTLVIMLGGKCLYPLSISLALIHNFFIQHYFFSFYQERIFQSQNFNFTQFSEINQSNVFPRLWRVQLFIPFLSQTLAYVQHQFLEVNFGVCIFHRTGLFHFKVYSSTIVYVYFWFVCNLWD